MRWWCRILLYALGLLLLVQGEVDAVLIAALAAAFAAGCFAGYFAGRLFSVLLCAAWTALSIMFPVFGFFWPLLLFDAVCRRMYYLAALPALCIALNVQAYQGFSLVALVFGVALALFLGVVSMRMERLSQEYAWARDDITETKLTLGRKNRELREAREYEVRIATLTERGRIAREIHDNVGHMLTRAMLQTGATMAVAKQPEVENGLAGLKETLSQAMDSVRQSVHGLRDEAFDLRGLIEGCVREFPGYEANVNYDMSPGAPRDVQYCFAAVIREAYANVQRHSDATRVHIDVQEHPAFYRLRFWDNGSAGLPAGSGGMGLDNMRERTDALGGQFYVQQEKGFGIHITIPKQEET